ncbi:MAG: hypothetical protein VKN72_27460 [Nostocales cyanobacterium 94392]|nr:hypothetical protein [Nostocales cyanobacterium 94392]
MPKIPECDRCRFYCGSHYLVCAVLPNGPDGRECYHFAPEPNAEPQELWEPQGVRYIDDELVIERVTYNGEEIRQLPQHWTREEQLELPDSHPMFTGFCPQCGYIFQRDYAAVVHWDCPECGWKDDSV